MKRGLVAGGVATIFAAGYLAGLLATGETIFTIGMVVPAGADRPPTRTAVYSATAIAVRAPQVAPAMVLPAAPAVGGEALAVSAPSTARTVAAAVMIAQSGTTCAVPGAAHPGECLHAKADPPPARLPTR